MTEYIHLYDDTGCFDTVEMRDGLRGITRPVYGPGLKIYQVSNEISRDGAGRLICFLPNPFQSILTKQ